MRVKRIVLVVAAAFALSSCGGKEQRLAAHLEKGREFFSQGDLDKARVELKNVLQIDPKVAEAYLMFGQIEERNANIEKAYANYRKAVELDPANVQAVSRLGRLYLFAGELEKAESSINDVLARQPDDLSALTLKAALAARQGDSAAATATAAKVVERDPANGDAVAVLAGLAVARGDAAGARKIIESGLVANSKSEDLRLALVDLQLRAENFGEAQRLMEELISLQPKKIDYRVNLARLHLAAKAPEKGEAVLREAIRADPQDDQRKLLLVDYMVSQNKVEPAEKELASAIAAAPDAYRLRFALIALQAGRGKPELAQRGLEEIIERDKTGPEGLRARSELAELQLRIGRRSEAERLIAEVIKANPRDNRALLLRGRLALDRGDATNAIADLRSVLKDQPKSLEVAVPLARAHLLNKEPQLAVETIGELVSAAPADPNLRLVSAEIKAATGDLEGGLSEIGAVLKQDQKNFAALYAKSNVEMLQKRWREAEATLIQLKNAHPDNAFSYYRLGEFYQVQGKLDQAEAAYEAALQRAPNAIEPLTGLANIDNARGKVEKAPARIKRVIEKNPENFLAYTLLGRVLGSQPGKASEAEQAFRKAVEIAPNVAGTHGELASFLVSKGEVPKAVEALEVGLAKLPGDFSLNLKLAETFAASGDSGRAIKRYEALATEQPDNDLVANNLASLLLDTRSDSASTARALELAKRFEKSNSAAARDTLGWAYFRSGEVSKALPHLEKAVELAPTVPVLHYHLGLALKKNGDTEKAKAHLTKAAEAKVDFPGRKEARELLGKS